MEKRLLLSQTCAHCYNILMHIYNNGMMKEISDKGVRIDMVNKNNEFAVDYMFKAVEWLSKNKDDDIYGDQESVTPILILESFDGIHDILVGDKDIIKYLDDLNS